MASSFLDLLACPKCHGSLVLTPLSQGEGLGCSACSLLFPIREGIPILLLEEALPLAASSTNLAPAPNQEKPCEANE